MTRWDGVIQGDLEGGDEDYLSSRRGLDAMRHRTRVIKRLGVVIRVIDEGAQRAGQIGTATYTGNALGARGMCFGDAVTAEGEETINDIQRGREDG